MSASSRSGMLLAAIIVVSAWLGAALLAAAVVAPAAFAVLPSRTLAGALVGGVLPALFVAGIAVSCAVVALTGSPFARGGPAGVAKSIGFAAIICAMGCAVSQFVITPRLDGIRAGIGGPIDALPPGDVRRVAFGVLHGYNVAGLGVAILAAAACLGIMVLTSRQRS